MQIKLQSDLSVLVIEGETKINHGNLDYVEKAEPALFAQVTREHLERAAADYPELGPAVAEILRQRSKIGPVPSPGGTPTKPPREGTRPATEK